MFSDIFQKTATVILGPWIIGYVGYSVFLETKNDVEVADYLLMPFGVTIIAVFAYFDMLKGVFDYG